MKVEKYHAYIDEARNEYFVVDVFPCEKVDDGTAAIKVIHRTPQLGDPTTGQCFPLPEFVAEYRTLGGKVLDKSEDQRYLDFVEEINPDFVFRINNNKTRT